MESRLNECDSQYQRDAVKILRDVVELIELHGEEIYPSSPIREKLVEAVALLTLAPARVGRDLEPAFLQTMDEASHAFALARASQGLDSRRPQAASLAALSAEVLRARQKFPGNRFLLAALMEEVGELARAYLQREGAERVGREAIQVACVAIRILEEGDATFDVVTDAEAKK